MGWFVPKKTLTEVVGACFSHNHRHADEEKPHFCSHRRNLQEAKARDRPTPLITLIKMEDAVLVDKITKMQNQKEVAQSRLVILNDRLAKHEHEMKCREHDATAAGELSENCV